MWRGVLATFCVGSAVTLCAATTPQFDAALTLYSAGNCESALLKLDASAAAAEPAPERPLYQGICLVKREAWAAAESKLAPFTARYPDDFRGWYWLAQAHLYQRKFDGALGAIGKAIERNDRAADAYRTKGQIELELGDHQEAYKAWLNANKLNPADPQTTYYLGRLFFEADFLDQAASWFRETLKLSPKHFQAMTYLAMCGERLHFEDTAASLYRAAIGESKRQGNPFAWAFLNYAKFLRQSGKEDQALQLLREAERLCPEAHALTLLGQMLAVANQPSQAEAVLRRAIGIDATVPDAHYRLGLLLSAAGRAGEAQAEMQLFRDTKSQEERTKREARIEAVRKD